MKKVILRRDQQKQDASTAPVAGVSWRNRLRMPGMLSVAVVSGLLSASSCGTSGPAASDGPRADKNSPMETAPASPETSPETAPASPETAPLPDAPVMADATDTTVTKDAGVDVRDGSSPQDVSFEFPLT